MMHSILLIVMMSAATVLIRFLPFLIFEDENHTPQFVIRLGRVLPSAVIAMLVVYCLKDVSVLSSPYGLPEFLALSAVIGLQAYKRNSLLSILGGTLIYMILIRLS